MDLAGQHVDFGGRQPVGRRAFDDSCGYAMAALLVALSVMGILLSVLMPVWKTTIQREREEELVFRGEQYVHAIGLFQRRSGPGVYPPSLDILVDQKFLRKKFKDPITGQDFLPLVQGQQGTATTPGSPNAPGTSGAVVQPQAGSTFSLGRGGATPGTAGGAPVGATGGIVGVVSRSKDKSFRLYNGRNHYSEWQFIYMPQQQMPGGVPGAATPGGRPGQPGQQMGPGGMGPGGRRGPGSGGFGPGRPGTTGVPTGTAPRPQPQGPGGPQQPPRGPGR